MTEIKDLLAAVKNDIEQENCAILKQAEETAAGYARQVTERLAKARSDYEKKTAAEISEISARLALETESEKKKNDLAVKSSFIRQVYSCIRNRILELEPESYCRLYGKFASRLSAGAAQTTGRISARTGTLEQKLNGKFFSKYIPQVKFDGPITGNEFEYGFILETEDFVVSLTIDSIMEEIVKDTRNEVSEFYDKKL